MSLRPNLLAVFRSSDKDGNGQIDAHELQGALSNGLGLPFNMNTVTKMIRIFDRDLSGCIEFNEFSELYDYISRWKQCFEAYDADRSGTIDERELMQALNSFGYRLSPTFVRTIIRRFDRSRRGVIGFDDFIYVLVCLQQLTIAFMPYDQAKHGFAMMNFEQFLLAAFATVS